MRKFSIKYGTICAALLLFSATAINGSQEISADAKTVKFNVQRNKMPAGFKMPPRREQTPVSAFYRYPVALQSFLRKIVRGAADTEINVDNNFDFQYTADLYLGSSSQAFNVIIDTGSNKLIILDSSCAECQGGTFDTSTSSSYVSSTDSDSIRYLDGSYVHGYKVQDTLSVDFAGTYSVPNFNFLLGIHQKGFETFGGLIGMTRSNYVEYDMFYDLLYTTGKTSSKTFAFYMADELVQSTFQFGGYDTSYIKSPLTDVDWTPLSTSNLFWDINIDGFRYGTNDRYHGDTSAYYLSYYSDGCLDTGTSLMLIPNELFETIMGLITSRKRTINRYGWTFSTCDLTQYESLFLLANGIYYEIPPSSYMIDFGIDGWCGIGFMQSDGHDWLIGDVFLKNFYSVWDDANDRVGLAPHITSSSTRYTTSDMPVPTKQFGVLDIYMQIFKNFSEVVVKLGIAGALLYGLYFSVTVVLHHFGILKAVGFELEEALDLFI